MEGCGGLGGSLPTACGRGGSVSGSPPRPCGDELCLCCWSRYFQQRKRKQEPGREAAVSPGGAFLLVPASRLQSLLQAAH